jgi:hypothetical protein
VTDDEEKPDLVSQREWLPWALYTRQGERLQIAGRFKSAQEAKSQT